MSSNTETASAPPSPPADINTGGGASVGGDVHAGRDFVGRDQYIINIIQAKQGQVAGRSFGVLVESMPQPAVRDAAMAFQTIFRDANDHIDVVQQHKQMHDQLHWLQVQFYDVVRYQESRFGGDEGAQATVEGAESVLRSAIASLRNVAQRARAGEMDVVWIDELDLAWGTLHEAIAGADAKLLRRAILGVGRVLSVQPTRVNKGLTDAAKALQFAALVEAMRKVFDCLHGADVDAAKLEEFQAGLDALAGLERGFTPLVAMHDRWQLVESDLVLLDSTLSRYKDAGTTIDYDELDEAWQSLRTKIEPLCRASAEAWSANIHRCGEQFEAALNTRDFPRLRALFRSFRRDARDRFVQVDNLLKDLCGELASAGKPLALVLRMMA